MTTPDRSISTTDMSAMIKLTHAMETQAVIQAWDDSAAQIAMADTARQATEDKRSIRRNRNRLYMLLAGFIMALAWPALCQVIGMSGGIKWTSAISVTGDLAVTAYALLKRY